MKAIQTKTTTPAHSQQQSSQPFFKKAGGESLMPKSEPFFSPRVQTKLSIGSPNDKYEQEADSMADKVVQRLATPDISKKSEPIVQAKTISNFAPISTTHSQNIVQNRCAECEKEEKLQKKENNEDQPELQLKPIFESGASDDDTPVQRKCATCGHEEEKKVQKKEGEENFSSPSGQSDGSAGGIESSLSASKGGGSPLPENTRNAMESSFGSDFSGVRIHTGSNAVQMSQDLNAQAFTHGNDIYFNAGKYDDSSSSGKHLLAHELTHTVQQGGGIQKKENVEEEQRNLIKEAIEAKDVGKIKDINPSMFYLADHTQKMAMINILRNQRWVGMRDEYYLAKIWNSYGNNLANILSDKANFEIWNDCIEKGADLYGITETMGLKLRFSQEVINIAKGYLNKNKEKANKEKERYGLNDLKKSVDEKQSNELTGLSKKAQDAEKILNIQKVLRTIPVGYHVMASRVSGRYIVDFEPNEKPSWAIENRWDKIKDTYDKLSAIIEGYVAEYPALFAIIQNDKIGAVKTDTDKKTMQIALSESLNTLLDNIDKADTILNDPKSKFPLELDPIHQQMFESRMPWNLPFQKGVAKKAIDEHENIEFWKTLGLGALQLGLFVVAEITSGGLATFFLVAGAAGSVGMAADSWKNYSDTKALSNTNLDTQTALLSKEKADAALVEAVLNTAFALLDVYGAGKAALKGVGNSADLAKTLAQTEEKEAKTLATVTESSKADIAKKNPLLQGINNETVVILEKNPELKNALDNNLRATNVLKKCASPCIPPNALPSQIEKLEQILKKAEDLNIDLNKSKLKQYFYENRGNLDEAIEKLENHVGKREKHNLGILSEEDIEGLQITELKPTSEVKQPELAKIINQNGKETKVFRRSGNAETDMQLIDEGYIIDISDFIIQPTGQVRLKPDFTPKKIWKRVDNPEKSGKKIFDLVENLEKLENRALAKQGKSPYIDDIGNTVDLHHVDQNFFTVTEHSSSYHQMEPDLHLRNEDPLYMGWRKLSAYRNNKISFLGGIFDSLREQYWRNRWP